MRIDAAIVRRATWCAFRMKRADFRTKSIDSIGIDALSSSL
jgi:hypothetical protein